MSMAPLPPLAPWVPASASPEAIAVVRHAIARLGVCEMPLGSNRSTLLDEWAREAGGELGSFWCANFATKVWREAGLPTAGKGKDPNCDLLMQWAKATQRWSASPSLGALVFYGPNANDATHVAIVVRTSPAILVVGGNERWGAVASRNGVAVQLRAEARTDILGYASCLAGPPP